MIPLADNEGSGRFPFWVVTIILVNVLCFGLEFLSPNPNQFIEKYALVPSLINFSDYHTLITFLTSQFLHAGFFHILSNMWFLWIFGDNVESKLGFSLFPLVYLSSGVIGNLAQYLIMPNSSIPTIGASGAVAGILGAYFGLFSHHNIKTVVPIFGFFTIANLPASFVLIYWFITQIFAGSASLVNTSYQLGGVAYFAHIGGFITGSILAKLTNQTPVLEEI